MMKPIFLSFAAAAMVIGLGCGCSTPAPVTSNYLKAAATKNPQLGNADLKVFLGPDAKQQDVSCTMMTVEVPAKETLAFHRLKGVETILVQTGNGMLTVDNRQIPISAGSVVSIPAGAVQSISNNGDIPLTYLSVIVPALRLGDFEFIK